ncbi:MAG: hypothetical protein ACR2IV_00670 [Bryobacteraceae bacterium]
MIRAAGLWLLCPIIAVCSSPDVQTIIKKSVSANEADWKAGPNYLYRERDRVGANTKTYEVTMILGSPYRRLMAVNEEPLSPQARANEQRKLERTTAQRREESPDQRQKRIAQYEKERRRDHLLMGQLTQAFDFKLIGSRIIESRDVYVLRATPRKGYRPPNMQAQVLPGMRGELWIDKETFQWVKVTAHVIRPVSIEGFLAQVQPGTRFELEKMPVDDGIWLARHFEMKSSAKILFMFNRSDQEDSTFFDYRKIPNSESASATGPGPSKSK